MPAASCRFIFHPISSRLRSTDFNLNSRLPRATALDAYIAAAILDALLNITTTISVFYGMWLYGIDEARPASIVDRTLPMLLLIVLGVGGHDQQCHHPVREDLGNDLRIMTRVCSACRA